MCTLTGLLSVRWRSVFQWSFCVRFVEPVFHPYVLFCVKDAMPDGQGVFKSNFLKFFIASTVIIKLHFLFAEQYNLKCNYAVKIQVTMEYSWQSECFCFFYWLLWLKRPTVQYSWIEKQNVLFLLNIWVNVYL